ncbi:Spo12 [Cordyceps fumosorosea ARSEF 2679]|uniref:Spo12 n=1 Tax=Cordyceps fumosorosea (strain ARSEF 2679) TaxID=1081104 RepID=A0A168DEP4_CORFA|nr:Spo12 [Cordyceps fumosorosea ARSEF 2679]OAA72517.1 Spo12 [Cordyceps fumosorosea ARSEF 2679]
MSSHVLGDKDVNASMEQQQQQQQQQTAQCKDVKSMDYHRQIFQSKMAQEPYVVSRKASSASFRKVPSTPPVTSSRPAAVAKNTANSSDASSCSTSSSSSSPCPSLVSDSASSASCSAPSPAPSITVLPRLPTNKALMVFSTKQYVSPSDNIMSPCSAKISALRNKQVNKAKPKSLFAQASAKKLSADNLFGSKSIPKE